MARSKGLHGWWRRLRGKPDEAERNQRFVEALAGRFSPATVIDVGVGHGTPWLYAAFPDSWHVLVEPVVEFREDIDRILDQYRGEHIGEAASRQSETRLLNVEPRRRTRSSFLDRTELTRTGDQPERREIPCRPLDAMAAERDWSDPLGLKVDVEGAELEVLRGAEQVLARCQFVVVEASVAERFHAGTRLHELTGFLADRGFALDDLLHVAFTRHQTPRRPQRADLLFTPRD